MYHVQMRHDLAPRRKMGTFHRVGAGRARVGPPTERLPVGQSAALIAGLSVFSWAVVISIVVTLRAVL
jgi:hypothetical protein